MDHSYLKKIIKQDDGTIFKVIQIKNREDGPWVTYSITWPDAQPQRFLLPLEEFKLRYGHNFH